MWRRGLIVWACAALFALVPTTALSSPAMRTARPGFARFVTARSTEHVVFSRRLPSRLLPNVRYAGTVTTQTFNAFMTSLTFDTNTNTIFFLSNSNFEELLASGQTSQIADLSSFGSASTVAWDANTQLFYVSVGSEIVAVTESGTVSVLAGSSTRGTQDGQGPNAQFQGPSGMGLDPVGHYLYVADSDRLRRVDEAGNVLTVGPSGVFGGGIFTAPFSVAFDTRTGDVAILDENHDDILEFAPTTQTYRTLAGACAQQPNGPGCIGLHEDGRGLHGLFAMTGSPTSSIAYDPRTNTFYVTDTFNNDLRKVDAKGDVATLAGNGTPALVDGVGLLAEFLDPTCVGLDPVNHTLLVCDTFGNLRIVTTTGQPAPLPPGFLALVPTPSVLSAPSGIARTGDGSLWFSESGTGLIGVQPAGTGKMHEYALPGGYFNPHGAAADPSGSIWFGDFDLSFTHSYLGRITSGGSVVETLLGGGCNFQSSPPSYFTPDGVGGVWLFNPCESSLVHRPAQGRLTQFVVPFASGLAMGNGFIWVGESNQLQQYAFDGTLLATFSGVGAGSGMLLVPDGDIWYINDAKSGEVGDFNPATGTTVVYQLPTCGCTRHIGDLTLGGDGAFWFTEAPSDPNRFYAGGMGRLTTDGTYTEYHTYEPRSKPNGATVDANGRVWFADAGANKLGYVP